MKQTILFDRSSIDNLKNNLKILFPEAKSSHLTESLAYSLGFSQNAALLPVLKIQSNCPGHMYLSKERFQEKMNQFGVSINSFFEFPTDGVPRKILVIDDSMTIRKAVSCFLKNHCFQVIAVGNGNDALSALEQDSFDSILCDFHLTDMDIFDFFKKIQHVKNRYVFNSENNDKFQPYISGIVPKPFGEKEILDVLK